MSDFVRSGKSNQGGSLYLTMPLVSNVPDGDKGWETVKCPKCGTKCWKRPGDEETIALYQMDGSICTICALKQSFQLK